MKGGSLLRVPISTLIAKADKQRFQQEKLREKRAEAENVSEQLAGPETAQGLFATKRIAPCKVIACHRQQTAVNHDTLRLLSRPPCRLCVM
jgi:hypothetical protein